MVSVPAGAADQPGSAGAAGGPPARSPVRNGHHLREPARGPAGCGRTVPGAAPRRRARCAAAAIAAISLIAVTGCSATATAPPVRASATAAPALDATLGQLAGVFARGAGFGTVKPSRIFNGGDPTGLVTHVTWKSWGGARAVATGTTDYVGPGQSVAAGRPERATIVAFDLGSCDGKLMYRAVEWYFPQHGQVFDARQYENICTGSYVPGR